jgi:hypothetical protein
MPSTSEHITGGAVLQPDSTLGRYRIVRHVGEGSWADVYEAVHITLGRRVALKVLKPAQQEAASRLRAEVGNVARLHHPGIVTLYDYGETPEAVFFMAMEWVDGPSLARRLEAGGLMQWREAARVASGLAAALAHAHEHHILHRDLKPQNVLLRSDGTPVLTDFGVAGTLLNTGRTQAGFVVGTPRYMAPEQLVGKANSPATDVFGLGLLLYEMMFGSLPDTDSVQELLISRATRQISVLERADLPPALIALLEHMLRLHAADRPASAGLVVARIDDILGAAENDAGRIIPHPVRASMNAERRGAAAPQSRKGILPLIAAGTVLLLVIATILVAFSTAGATTRFAFGLLQGALLIAAGVFGGRLISRALAIRRSQFDRDAGHVLAGTRDRSALTQTIAFQVDELIARTHAIDAHVLGATIVQMVHEYDHAKESSDRQAALMNTAQLLEKLMQRLSPWYVRHDKAIAFAVSAVGIVAGVVKIVSDIVRLAAGG